MPEQRAAKRTHRALLALLVMSLSSCGGDSVCSEAKLGDDTAASSYLGLSPLQLSAIGSVRLVPRVPEGIENPTPIECTGVLIAPRWVLSAAHCTLGMSMLDVSFALGPDATNATRRVHARWLADPDVDVALLELDEAVSASEAEPLRPLSTLIEAQWLGRSAEAAGYGRHADGRSGQRELFAEQITRFGDTFVWVDALGGSGTCYGDSGAPLYVRAADGGLRVMGVLSAGSATCSGVDRFVRLDHVIAWITAHTGPLDASAAAACAGVSASGLCLDGTALYCDGQQLRSETCTDQAPCGWDRAHEGYRCRDAASDPCDGIDQHGSCRGAAAVRCNAGHLVALDCAACDLVCGLGTAGSASCLPH